MTTIDTPYVYEIEFDVLGRQRDKYDEWLSSDSIEWINHPAVDHFEVFQNEKGLSPEMKFVFGFETLSDWATFVGSEEHKVAIKRISALSENREAVLWERASVKLSRSQDTPVRDGGRNTDWQTEPNVGIPQ